MISAAYPPSSNIEQIITTTGFIEQMSRVKIKTKMYKTIVQMNTLRYFLDTSPIVYADSIMS